MPIKRGFDSVYFAKNTSWRRRLVAWIARELGRVHNSFLQANAEIAERVCEDPHAGARMAVNLPSDALLSFLKDGRYKNAYERPVVAGRDRGTSTTRRKVDALLDLREAHKYYFGAVIINGCGVGFYGEYCLVLRPDKIARSTRLLDRNSYDLGAPPVDTAPSAGKVLRGRWRRDLSSMVALRVLQRTSSLPQLVTTGLVSESVVEDEHFIEVQKQGTFRPKDVEEVRVSPDVALTRARIRQSFRDGHLPSPTELAWAAEQSEVEQRLRANGIPIRLAYRHGRTGRWR